MREWLNQVIQKQYVSPELLRYMKKRGATDALISELGLCNWVAPNLVAPDPEFRRKFGPLGQKLDSLLIIPVYNPRGILTGFEARSIVEKEIWQYRILPDTYWNSVWIGVAKQMGRILETSTIWIVEGLWDLIAVRRALGDEPVLATLRAYVSPQHHIFLQRFVSCVNMAYDNDEAGKKGFYAALKKFRQAKIECVSVKYPGKDPGDLWERVGDQGVSRYFSIF